MMISKEEVQRIADLARIRMDEKELKKLCQDLSGILDYFALLKDVDTSKVEATTHSILLENAQREDTGLTPNQGLVEKLTAMFPATKEGFLKVQAIFSSK